MKYFVLVVGDTQYTEPVHAKIMKLLPNPNKPLIVLVGIPVEETEAITKFMVNSAKRLKEFKPSEVKAKKEYNYYQNFNNQSSQDIDHDEIYQKALNDYFAVHGKSRDQWYQW